MFKLPDSSDRWAQALISKSNYLGQEAVIKTKFDVYYFFLMAGIANGTSLPLEKFSMSEFTKYVPEDFLKYRHVIAGLLLCAELVNKGIPLERESAQCMVLELFDERSSSLLSPRAMDTLNGYALKGSEIVMEEMPQPPAQEVFLIWFASEMLPRLISQGAWAVRTGM